MNRSRQQWEGRALVHVGPQARGCTSRSRRDALAELGFAVRPLDVGDLFGSGLWGKLQYRSGVGPQVRKLNREVSARCGEAEMQGPPGILWLERVTHLWPGTLARLRRRGWRVVLFCVDDMANPVYRVGSYPRILGETDLAVTTKSYNVAEMQREGAGRVAFMDNAYDPAIHHPLEVTEGERARFGAEVSFVGTYRPDRAELLSRLSGRLGGNGTRLRLFGGGWQRCRSPLGGRCEGEVIGDDYARVICASRINLGLLNHENRDLQTTRSVEIPACGGFMLAEWTREHCRLFAENQEAVYFRTFDELTGLIDRYLHDEAARLRIRRRGLERCRCGGYSYRERIESILQDAGIQEALLS